MISKAISPIKNIQFSDFYIKMWYNSHLDGTSEANCNTLKNFVESLLSFLALVLVGL
jgi:hypothetical protein